MKISFGAPAASEENWQRDTASLFALNRQLQEAVRHFPVERLFAPLVADPPYSAITQFIGVTQHNLYHVGQIILLAACPAAPRPR